MLIILGEEGKLRDSNDIENIISAEIPEENDEPELFEIVKSCMIHGPCGSLNPNCVCMENGICKKNLETLENVNGYPAYKRRNNGRTVRVGRFIVDNRYIAPYSAAVLKKIQIPYQYVKYLFKYVYKGHNCANMEMVVDQPNSIDELHDMERNLEHDEIAAYLNCRYISDWLYIYQSSKRYTIENLQQLKEHPLEILKILTLLHGLS